MDRIKPRERATRPTTLWAVAASTPGKPEMDDLDISLSRHRRLTSGIGILAPAFETAVKCGDYVSKGPE